MAFEESGVGGAGWKESWTAMLVLCAAVAADQLSKFGYLYQHENAVSQVLPLCVRCRELTDLRGGHRKAGTFHRPRFSSPI